ncbi:MAG: hypothetical protein A3B69_00105 [Gammaproteobacteria bacterium RIFCSPHIGHO2_02_FULL_38_33]|nr:MAG: hypothetical protein A3B69_00105 [Gammaproteobacteria bacterium RIFCSPHIGHO2_02_FULL_38_33]
MGKHKAYNADDESEEKLTIFKEKFPKHMEDVVGKRISRREVSPIHRRLDALARLLEHDQICVAVRYDLNKKKIIISSNKIHHTSKKTNMHIKNIEKMMKLLANHKASMHKIIDKLSYVIAKNFYQEFWRELKGRSFYDIKKEVKKQLSHLFNSGQETKIWQENCLKRNTGSEASLIDRTSRLARDFIKLRKSILNLSSEKGESKAILESLRDQNFSFSRTGSSHRHAEMRQMYAFSNLTSQERKASYIGISKLSCRRCSSVTKSLGIPTRGQHGRVFKQWEAPRFFKKDPDLLEKFFGHANDIVYEDLSDREKIKAWAFIQGGEVLTSSNDLKTNMLPDSSSSDEAFGLSDASDDIDTLKVENVICANDAKTWNRKAYDRLLGEEVSPEKIVKIFQALPEKFDALGSRCVRDLLKDDSIEFDELERLFDENPVLFQFVTEDQAELISKEGFEGAVARYRKALEKLGDEDLDVNEEAERDYYSKNEQSSDESSSNESEKSSDESPPKQAASHA